eukprot:TRINITY_DN61530_c0_g1_i1.p1 TRINITY_DN61530_c0_g1~~TRINITY_DN61530_c0_g1_i1.p1  ORF type:complete len:715 (+),score=157.29 TRINITY_DN61530_c0_g1_i1:107-2146(+)
MDWTFDEHQVAQEREESLARTQKAKDLVEAQEQVLTNIMNKMVESEEECQPSVSVGSGHNRSRFRSNASMSSLDRMETGGSSASTFEMQAWTVADQIVARQEKSEAFNRRRKETLGEAAKQTEKRKAEMEAAEARFAERQKEIAEDNRRRAFASQQRRSEQQKTRKENLRELDRICDDYYKEQSPRGRKSSPSPGSSPRQNHRSHPQQKASVADEDIYKHTVQSHGLYNETVERWRQQVSENDRRAEDFRRKVLKAVRSGSRQKEENVSGSKKSKGARRISGMHPASSDGRDTSPEVALTRTARSVPSSLGSSRVLSPTAGLWPQRRQKAMEWAMEVDRLEDEKLRRDEALLQAGRSRIARINQDTMDRAFEQARQWQIRNDTATARRKKNEVTSDAEMRQKMEDFARRRAELEQRHFEERAEAGDAKRHLVQSAQAAAQLLLDGKERAMDEKVKERDDLLAERYAIKLEAYIKKVESGGPYYEKAERAKLQKKKLEETFRKKAMKEVEKKTSRQIGVMGEIQKRASSPSSRAAMLSEMAKQPKAAAVTAAAALERQWSNPPSRSAPPTAGSHLGSADPELTITPADLGEDLTQARVIAEAVADAPALEKRGPHNVVRRSPAQKPDSASDKAAVRRPSILSLSDDDGGAEDQLLQDLEKRSSSWMKEMRRKKQQTLTKF